MAKTLGTAFSSVQRIERQQRNGRNKLYKEVVQQGQDAIEELTTSVQAIQSIIDTIEGVGVKRAYTFSSTNPGEAVITAADGRSTIVLPNPLGNRELFVQITENNESNNLIAAAVNITEAEVTLILPSSALGSSQEYTAVIFG